MLRPEAQRIVNCRACLDLPKGPTGRAGAVGRLKMRAGGRGVQIRRIR